MVTTLKNKTWHTQFSQQHPQNMHMADTFTWPMIFHELWSCTFKKRSPMWIWNRYIECFVYISLSSFNGWFPYHWMIGHQYCNCIFWTMAPNWLSCFPKVYLQCCVFWWCTTDTNIPINTKWCTFFVLMLFIASQKMVLFLRKWFCFSQGCPMVLWVPHGMCIGIC